MEHLKQSLRQSSRVVIVVQIASQVVSLAVLAVLYRLLGPEPYGLLGMVLPLLVLLRIFITAGLDLAAVQQAELTEQQVSALFWINQVLGLVVAVVMVACAPLLVWFYGVDQLRWLTVALAGSSVAVVLSIQHQALLQRKLRLGTLAVVRLAALALGGLAGIGAAVAQSGVWALVVQHYVELLALAGLAWIVEPWRPSFAVRGARIGRFVRFGGHLTLSSLMFYLSSNADKILVGFVLGPRALGLYSQAFSLMMKPVHVVITPLSGIMFPVLSRAVGNHQQYQEFLLGFFRFIGLLMLPAGIGLLIVAPEAMRVLGGPEWADAGPILAALAAAILVQGFFNALGGVFASVGRTDRLFYGATVIAIVLCTAFVFGLRLGRLAGAPLLGVAWSYSFTMLLILFPLYLWFALRTVGVPYRLWLAQLHPALPAALGMGLIVAACHWLLSYQVELSDAALLSIEILVGAFSYTLFARREIRRLLVGQ